MPASVRISINEAMLGRFTMPGGSVHRHVNTVAREVAGVMAARAPKRTGRLAASIRTGGGSFNQYGCSERITVNVPYGKWVAKGTAHLGYITSNSGGAMGPLPAWNGYKRGFAEFVRGQRANTFMTDALNVVMASHAARL
jgi:hypothetical protein